MLVPASGQSGPPYWGLPQTSAIVPGGAGKPIVGMVNSDPTGDLAAQIRDAAENAPYLAPDADPIEGASSLVPAVRHGGTFERAIQSFRTANAILDQLSCVP